MRSILIKYLNKEVLQLYVVQLTIVQKKEFPLVSPSDGHIDV